MRAISRGDSRFVELGGAVVTPADPGGVLQVGGQADLCVFAADAGRATAPARANEPFGAPIATVRAGRVVEGRLPPGRPAKASHDA